MRVKCTRRLQPLAGARVAAAIHLELAAAKGAKHWTKGKEDLFVETERTLRDLNRSATRLNDSGGGASTAQAQVLYDAFISHSFRRPSTQEMKRRLISEMSRVRETAKPGLVYWADFLDLAERGPVPWRKEIEEGIRNSVKVLAFIDKSFLCSYNCIMEIAAAFEMHKPVVPVILDKAAWTLLTTPNAAEDVWNQYGELRSFDGQTSIGGNMFNLEMLKSVFTRLSNINFCSCLPDDAAHMGIDRVADRFYNDATKDLPYLKEWTQLEEQTLRWFSSGKHSSFLLSSDSLKKLDLWSAQAFKYSMEPPPTALQMQFIKASASFAARRTRILCVLAVFVLLCILGGAIGSAVMGVQARQAAADARAQAKIADEKSKLAITNSDLAKASQIIAEQKTVEAERNMNIAAVLLLGSNPHPSTGRSMRALLKSFELARDIDRLDMVMPQLHEAVRYLAAEPFWPFELEGHFDSSCVSFSPSGEYLLSGGQDYTYRLWSLRVPEGSFVPAARPPKVLTCEVDGESLAVDWGKGDLLAGGTSHYNSICLWHKDATGEWTLREKLQPLDSPGNADISTVAFSPSGNLLAAGSTDGSLIVWNVSSASSPAAPRVLVPANETEAEFVQYRAVAWSPDDAYLITGGIDRVLRVWEVEGGAVVATNPTTTDINAVDVLADGGVDDWETLRIAAVTDLYDSESFVLFLALEKVGTGNVSLRVVQSIPGAVDQKGVAWSPDNGSMLAVTGDDYRVHLWALNQTDGTATTRLHDMQLSYDVVSRSRSLAWGRQSPAQHHPATSVDILAAATANGAIYMFQRAPDLRDLGPRLDRMYCHLAYEAGLKHSVRGQAITSDMSKLATSAFHGTICIFRRDPNTLRWRNTEVLGGYGAKGVAPKRAVVWSPDNSLLAVGSDDGMLYVYGFRGNEEAVEVAAFIAHESACRFVSFDPTSRYVVSSGDRSDPTILIREVGAGPERELRLPLHTHQVRCVTWIAAAFGEASSAAMGVIASVGDDGGIRVTEIQRAADGKLSLTRTVAPGAAEAGRYVSLAWGAASGLLAAGDTHGGVTLWRRSDSWGGEWNDTHHSNSHTASVDNLVWVRSSLVSGSKDMAMGVVEVDPVTKRVVRNYKTDVDCRIPFAVEESRREGGGPRVVCLRARSSVAGDKWTDPELPVTVEAETVLVGFDHQYDLFQKMVYGRLSLDDLAALGYQDLARLAAP